jgi:hypothetical protein
MSVIKETFFKLSYKSVHYWELIAQSGNFICMLKKLICMEFPA